MLGKSEQIYGQDALSSVQMSAAVILSTQPDAFACLLGKSAKKLREDAGELVGLLHRIDKLLQCLLVPPEPVKDLASLRSAKASAMQMELHVYRPDLSQEYAEFSENLGRFLKQATALKGDGEIRLTREQARKQLGETVELFFSQLNLFIQGVTNLKNAVQDFEKSKAAPKVAKDTFLQVRKSLEEEIKGLEEKTEIQRFESFPELIPRLLMAKAALRSVIMGQEKGAAVPYADAQYPGQPAEIICPKIGPYAVLQDDNSWELKLWVKDDVVPTDKFYLPESYWPRLDNYPVAGPFEILAGVSDQLRLVEKAENISTELLINFPAGILNADQVRDIINGVLNISFFQAETYHAPVRYQGYANCEDGKYKSPSPFWFPTHDGISLIQVGDVVTCLRSGHGNEGKTGVVTHLKAAGGLTVEFGMSGVWENGNNDFIEVCAPGNYFRIIPKNKRDALERNYSLQHDPQTEIQRATGILFGFSPQEFQKSFISKPRDIVGVLKNFLPANISTVFEPVARVKVFRDKYSFQRVSLCQLELICDIPSGTGELEIKTSQDMTGFEGAYFRIMEGDYGVIGKINSTSPLRVEFPVDISGGENIRAHVIHSFFGKINSVRFEHEPYTGEYELEPGNSFFDWNIIGFPWDVVEEAQVGVERLVFTSRDTSQNSFLAVDNSQLTGGIIKSHGKARFLQMPFGVQEGTEIILETNSGNISRKIISVKGLMAELNESIDFSPSWDFSAKKKPRARIVDSVGEAQREFLEEISGWLILAKNTGESGLKVISEIKNSKNISASKVKVAQFRFMVWQEVFSGVHGILKIFDEYKAPECPSVDSIFSVLRQEGLDHAFDLLVGCRFSEFFSLGKGTGSYAGMVRACIREIAQKDVGKITEPQVFLQASFSTPDYDYEEE